MAGDERVEPGADGRRGGPASVGDGGLDRPEAASLLRSGWLAAPATEEPAGLASTRTLRASGLAGLLPGIGMLACGVLLSQFLCRTPGPLVEPAATPGPDAQLAIPQPSDSLRADGYRELVTWVQQNAAYLNGIGFVLAAEEADRLRPSSSRTVVPTLGNGPEGWRRVADYQAVLRQTRIRRLELNGMERWAPFKVTHHAVIEPRFEGTAYTIEVVTWDAYPGFPVPANIYRPSSVTPRRFPVIVTPLGCQTHLATHNELNSVQRRAANFALRGFLVFAMADGTCFNGLAGERLENQFAFEQYGRLAGSGFRSLSLGLLMFLRALDYLATRPDTDMSRVGVTGYSYGGVLSYYLAAYDPRVAAVALVATAIEPREASDDRIFSDRRHAAMSSGSPDLFLTLDTDFSAPGEEPAGTAETPGRWNGLDEAVLLVPRPFYIVQGRADPGTSLSATRRLVDSLTRLYAAAAPDHPRPEMVVVDGSHTFDARRRRLVTDWFAAVLRAEALLPPPADRPEHETPVFSREILERTPHEFRKRTVRDIHKARALAAIADRRTRRPFAPRTVEDGRRLLRQLLMLPDEYAARVRRPILLDERGFALSGELAAVSRFWLLPLTGELYAAALTVDSGTPIREVALHVIGNGPLVPPSERLVADLAAGRAVTVLYLPGFGPLRSTQEKLGMLAVRMPSKLGRTLLGVGVESVGAALNLVHVLYPGARVLGHSEGVDAGNVLAFAAALDARLAEVRLVRAVRSFQDFLTSPANAIPAPTLAIPGLAAWVDVSDLQRLAGAARIRIESTSDLSEYVLDLRS